MDNYNTFTNQGQFSFDDFYPDVYREIYPIVVQVADDMRSNRNALTNDMLNHNVDNIIKMSGMWDEDSDSDSSFNEAIPVQAGFGRRRHGRRGRRRFHNRHTLRDLTRILLLRELLM